MHLLVAARELAVVLGLLGLCTAVGQVVVNRIYPLSLRRREQVLFSMGIGIGCVGTLILLWGIVGIADATGLLFLLSALTILAWGSLRELASMLRQAVAVTVAEWSRTELVVIGLITLFVLGHAALPPTDFDSLFYHLAIPEIYLREGRIFLTPDNLHAAYVGVVHMLYLPLLAFGGPGAPALFSGVLALSLIPLIHLIGEKLWDSETGRLAALLAWGGPILILVAVTPRIDVTLVWYLLLGHYALIGSLDDSSSAPAYLWLGGLVLGIAVAAKLSAAVYILALGPVLLLTTFRVGNSWGAVLRTLGPFCLAVLVTTLPWLIRNWVWLGDPIYPRLTAPATPAWLHEVYGGDTAPSPHLVPPLQQIRIPFNLLDFLFAPHRLTPEGEGFLYFANPVLWILPLSLLDGRWKQKILLAVPAVLYGLGVLIIHPDGTNLRYMLPAVLPLSLVPVAALAGVFKRRARSLTAVVIMLPLALSMTLWSASRPGLLYFGNRLSEAEFLSMSSNQEMRTVLNEETRQKSQILMLFDSRGFGIERSVIPDPGVTNWLRMGPAVRLHCLQPTSITHVVVNRKLLGYHSERGLDLSTILWEEFTDFSDRCLVRIHDGGWFEVYRLEPGNH